MADVDIAIIGGGLNGVCLARDAAGRGLRVALFEQNDLGGGAAPAAPHLMHGNFIDLEHGNVLRVRGSFGLRPTAVAFDFEFQWYNGKWRLFGVAISPMPLATQQPASGPEVPDARRRGGQ